jgi:hypothetical protein
LTGFHKRHDRKINFAIFRQKASGQSGHHAIESADQRQSIWMPG